MSAHPTLLSRYRVIAILAIVAMCLATIASPQLRTNVASADPTSVWGAGTLTDQNLWDLMAQMTVAEKNTFIHGSNAGNNPGQTPCSTEYVSPWVQGCQGEAGRIPGVPTLGIPPLRLADGPAGVRLGHVETSMPAPVGLTASFDRSLAYLFGAVVGRGQRATNQDVWLAPMMNMVNVPTAGRNFETLGEDPYLSGEFGLQLTLGAQSEGTIATLKHYVDNDFENGRNSTSVLIDERTQREMELAPFEKSIKAGGAGAVMCSYNRVNDVYACSNDLLLNGILKSEWAWDGFVMSDWGATHTPQDLIWGLDMEQSGSNNLGNPVVTYVTNGTGSPEVAATNDMPYRPAYSSEVWSARLDDAVFRILKQMNKAGLLEGTQYGTHSNGCNRAAGIDCVKWIPPRADLQAIQLDEFAKAQQIAEASAVLLKNDDHLLPLTSADLAGNGVLVMGPTAFSAYTGGGGSAHVRPYDPVQSPYDALVAAAGASANIRYVQGYDLDGEVVPSAVLMAPETNNPYSYWTLREEDAQFNNLPGLLRQQIMTATVSSGSQPMLYDGADRALDQLDSTINYIGENTLPVNTAWRWTGLLTAPASPVSGTYQLKIFVAGQSSAQLFTEGLATSNRRINRGAHPTFPTDSVASQGQTSKSHDPAAKDMLQSAYNVVLNANQQVHLDLRVYAGATPTQVRFMWIPIPADWQTAKINEAAAAASTANKVVIWAYDEGTEGSDRGGNAIANGLALPGYQDQLISAVAAANPNTIVVLNTGDPVFMPWINSVKSVLEMWYPGQMGGPATANVLLGNVNPGGKLPETFYDGSAPIGQRFPQDTQNPSCANGTANYGTSSSGPGASNPNNRTPNPGICPMYPGIYTQGFLWNTYPATQTLHNYRTINYSDFSFGGIQGNGIFQGYRWFDKNDYAPLFPFGHGLSYTEFEYSDLAVQPNGDGYDVSFVVKNVGSVAGAEVPQVYVGQPLNPPVPMAEKALAGFERIELAAGESRQVTIHIGARELSYWSVDVHDWVMVGGYRPIYVGSSSRDIRLENWEGFIPPVSNEVVNEVNAGSIVPVKFSLYGDYGLDIFNPGSPQIQPIDCVSGENVGAPIPTTSVPGLKYDPTVDQYIYAWKTEKPWAGTCARLEVQVDYDTVHTTNFVFTK